MPNVQGGDSLEKAAFLMLITRMIVKGLGLLSTLILVRLLMPEDFGLVAVAMAIYGLIEVFGMFGFNSALVQKGDPSERDYNIVFTFNLLFAIAAFLLTYFSAPYLAVQFDDPRVVDVLQWVSVMFLINGLKNIKIVKFQIDMDFKKELQFQIVPKFLSFIFTISAAWYLKSYMALVYGMLFNSVIIVVVSYRMVPYIPKLALSGAKELWGYSKWLMLNSLLHYFNTKMIELVVGKFISIRASGLYNLGNEISTIPLNEVCAPINKASFAAYSKHNKDTPELKKLLQKTTAMITVLVMPMSAGMFITAETLVPVVLGKEWVDAIPVVQFISLATFVTSATSNIGYLFMAVGRPKMPFVISLFRTTVFFSLMALLMGQHGLLAVLVAYLIGNVLASILTLLCSRKMIGIGFRFVHHAIARPLYASLMMILVVYLITPHVEQLNDVLSLMAQVFAGGATYAIILYLMWSRAQKPEGIEADLLRKIRLHV